MDEEKARRRREYMKEWEKSPARVAYRKEWWKNNPKAKAIRHKFATSEKGKEYYKTWDKEHPDKVILKRETYHYTIKGTVKYLKTNERRKFGDIISQITPELIEMVNERDKNCVYCGKELVKEKHNRQDVHYDHLNPNKPASKDNFVRCCSSCNHKKFNKDVLVWCKFKGYVPAPVVLELYPLAYDNRKD